MSDMPFAVTTPISVARVGLKARDADALASYYREVVGLAIMSRKNGTVTLGAGHGPCLKSRTISRRFRTTRAVPGSSILPFFCRRAPISDDG